MVKTIAIANQKGGVTKTTATFNIAAAMAEQGKKVLMVDLDSQASLTISAGLEPLDMEYTVCDLLKKRRVETAKCVYELENIKNLSIIPSIIDLAALEMELQGRTSREKILSRSLKEIKDDYDYIIIDCPPQLSILTLNALAACDYVIIPCKTDYLSYRGLEQLNETIKDVQDLINPAISVKGVIATLYEKNVKDHNEILDMLAKQYRIIGTTKKTAEATKGVYDGMPVVLKNKKTDIAKEYMNIAEIIMKEGN